MPNQRQLPLFLMFYVGFLLLGMALLWTYLNNILSIDIIGQWRFMKSATFNIIVWMGLMGMIFYERGIVHVNLKNIGIASLGVLLIPVATVLINFCYGHLAGWFYYIWHTVSDDATLSLYAQLMGRLIKIALYFIAFYGLRYFIAQLDGGSIKNRQLATDNKVYVSQMALTITLAIIMVGYTPVWGSLLAFFVELFFGALMFYFSYVVWGSSLRERGFHHYNLEKLGAITGLFLLVTTALMLLAITLIYHFFAFFLSSSDLLFASLMFILTLLLFDEWIALSIVINLFSLLLLYGLGRYLMLVGGDFYQNRHKRLMILLVITIIIGSIPLILFLDLISPIQIYYFVSNLLLLIIIIGWVQALIQIFVVRLYRRISNRRGIPPVAKED